jgi:hypothetical protein
MRKSKSDDQNKEDVEMESIIVESSDTAIQASEEEIPQFIKIEEFLSSVSRKYPIESLGGFVSWIKKDGMPRKLPFNKWKELLDTFRQRKV